MIPIKITTPDECSSISSNKEKSPDLMEIAVNGVFKQSIKRDQYKELLSKISKIGR